MFIDTLKVNFWKDKRVLITGHTGFKGSWLSLWLQTLGAEIRGIALEPPTSPALFNLANVHLNMDHKIADIRDFEKVRSLIADFRPEIIIHMAAQPLVRLSYEQPVETYATNIMGTIHVLEAARQSDSVRAIVNVTTDKCYENQEWVWGYRESDSLGGYDPYSNSKGCVELVSSAYRKSFFVKENIAMATARAGNVIGGGDWAHDRLMPDILNALGKNQTVMIRNPHAIRPWQHVLEPLSGYLLLAEKLYITGQIEAESWNFGPSEDDAKSVEWIVKRMCTIWGPGSTWKIQDGDHPHETNYLKLDISKAKNRLNWSPRWSLNTALEKINNWEKSRLASENIRNLCIEQISDFENYEI